MANFYTDSDGADPVALRTALVKLQAQATNGTAAVFLLMKADLQGNLLGTLLGEDVVRKLKKNGTVTALGLTIVLLTAREANKITFAGPVLALYVSADAMRRLDNTTNDVIFVPWMKEDLAAVLKAGKQWTKL